MPDGINHSSSEERNIQVAIQTAVQSALQYGGSDAATRQQIDVLKVDLSKLKEEVSEKTKLIDAAAAKADKISERTLGINVAMSIGYVIGLAAILSMALDYFYFERTQRNELIEKFHQFESQSVKQAEDISSAISQPEIKLNKSTSNQQDK